MVTELQERRHELLTLEPQLRACADGLTRDVVESQSLVLETLTVARSPDYDWSGAASTRARIFQLLRQRFYSAQRDRDYRRSRSAFVTEMSCARKRMLQANGGASDV